MVVMGPYNKGNHQEMFKHFRGKEAPDMTEREMIERSEFFKHRSNEAVLPIPSWKFKWLLSLFEQKCFNRFKLILFSGQNHGEAQAFLGI